VNLIIAPVRLIRRQKRVALRLLKSAGTRLDHALRSYGRNDPCEFVAGSVKQCSEFSLVRSRPPVITSMFRSRSLLKQFAPGSGTTISTSETLLVFAIALRQYFRILILRSHSNRE
jgi:hypothetical protein